MRQDILTGATCAPVERFKMLPRCAQVAHSNYIESCYILRYMILLQLNPTVNRHVQFVYDQAIYKADFGEKSSNNNLMHMF